ncbi:DUF974 domain-containing protein [Karstenula rhodostoma CBS 690.94]|uniref:DUF974 domain-containing protein n=1 Tax=Karstenula rhodostoma CBS 690.94 TaxID=1392251 RepID=A0A9P4PES2_9PLEO|nr:DUF974 domain-containing protein [Karstenula rhodostoma CBS 690.94]
MAQQRHASTADALKTPHSVSLKVLRLSRPSFATQYPLPASKALGIAPTASLAYPSSRTDDKFILSPVLQLPEAFGSAYVGENFSCTLCANNELEAGNASKTISGVRIQADMQTPSVPNGTSLELSGHDRSSGDAPRSNDDIGPGESLQRILRFELKEEGNHVLAVTVTYTETALAGEGIPTGGKVRTFRKLYQFVAQQLLSVRTKAGEIAPGRHLLEAQLENMGEGAVSLEDVRVNPTGLYKGTSLNWDLDEKGETADAVKPVLMAREVIQVAFLLEEKGGENDAGGEGKKDQLGDNRKVLGQLAIQWRTALGDRGTLSTGWLTARR